MGAGDQSSKSGSRCRPGGRKNRHPEIGRATSGAIVDDVVRRSMVLVQRDQDIGVSRAGRR